MSIFPASRFPAPRPGDQKPGDKETEPDETGGAPEFEDEKLLARLQAGDQDALGRLFERHSRLLRGIATRILKDATEAEDLVQDLFLFIRRKCAVFDGSKSSARSWIVQMAYHRAIERRRYLATRQFYSHAEQHGGTTRVVGPPTGEDDYSAEVVFGRNGLGKVLDALSEDQRETLRLYFFEGYTLAEIGAKLGQPLGNVRHHYYRGLDKLRKQMFRSREHITERHGKKLAGTGSRGVVEDGIA